jgi:transglutaminase-like putative cysteine protease
VTTPQSHCDLKGKSAVKLRLEFNLPDETEEAISALNGGDYKSILFDLVHNKIRGDLKHGHQYKDADEALEAIRDYVCEYAHSLSVSID